MPDEDDVAEVCDDRGPRGWRLSDTRAGLNPHRGFRDGDRRFVVGDFATTDTRTGRWEIVTFADGAVVVQEDNPMVAVDPASWLTDDAQRAVTEEQQRKAAAQVTPHERADELFRSLLSAEQLHQVERGYVIVTGSEGNRFKIALDDCAEGNIYWLDENDRIRGQFCAAPARWLDHYNPHRSYGQERILPVRDAHLGQLLALISDERAFMNIAHLYGGAKPRYPLQKPAVPGGAGERRQAPPRITRDEDFPVLF